MGGPIVRTGTTPEFWANYDKVFGGKKKPKKQAAKTAAKSAKKASKKTGKKKSAKAGKK